MNIIEQVISLIFSFTFGFCFSFVFYKFKYYFIGYKYKKLFSSLFISISVFLFLVGMYFINNLIIHIYHFLIFSFGFIVFRKTFLKCKGVK